MDHNMAGYQRRFVAYLIDVLIITNVLTLPLILIALGFKNELPEYTVLNFVSYLLAIVFLSGLLKTLYHVYFISTYGATPGKLLLGIEIVESDNNKWLDKKLAFYRYIAGYSFSIQFFGYGFFKMIKHPQNLAWHDQLFNTRVILKHDNKAASFLVLLLAIAFAAQLYYIGYLAGGSLYVTELLSGISQTVTSLLELGDSF